MSRVESTVFGRNFLGFFLVFWKAGVRIVFIGYGDSQRVGFFANHSNTVVIGTSLSSGNIEGFDRCCLCSFSTRTAVVGQLKGNNVCLLIVLAM
jgi:hypothetical protein